MTELVEMAEEHLIPLYAMRNDPAVLAAAISSQPVSWYEHEAIFRYANYPKYVYKLDGNVIGFVDFKPYMLSEDPRVTEWSFHMAPWARGKKLAIPMLREALDKVHGLYDTVMARVLEDNSKSIRVHEKLGFKLEKMEQLRLYKFVWKK